MLGLAAAVLGTWRWFLLVFAALVFLSIAAGVYIGSSYDERYGYLNVVADSDDVAVAQVGPHRAQARRVVIGQRPQQDGVDDAEDRRGGADAERVRQNRRDGERRLALQIPAPRNDARGVQTT